MRKRRLHPSISQANDNRRPSLSTTYLKLRVDDETMLPSPIHRLVKYYWNNWTRNTWDRRKHEGNLMTRHQVHLLLLAAVCCYYAAIHSLSLRWILFGRQQQQHARQNLRRGPPIHQSVLLLRSNYDSIGMLLPDHHILLEESPNDPDYGGIQGIGKSNSFGRSISLNDEADVDTWRGLLLDAMDVDMESRFYHNDELEDETFDCRRNNWQQKVFHNCNDFHTLSIDRTADGLHGRDEPSPDIKYLGHGFFRAAFLLQSPVLGSTVLKCVHLHEDFVFDVQGYHTIHRDAIVMERLSSSPRTVDIYGHCGTSILSETMVSEMKPELMHKDGWIKPKDLKDQNDVRPQNNYTVAQKLQVALEMAESIADLHGYEEGIIIHGDVHPVQWLRTSDGTMKLNDFNNAEILDWDGTSYCNRWRWFGGMYRSPEEFRGDYIDEKMDVFSMGNNLYVLLTGLLPYYYLNSYEEVQAKVLNGTRPFLDDRYRTRSFGESKMIELMEQCWEYDAEDRPDIFQVVQFLRQVIQDNHNNTNTHNMKKA